MADSDEELDKRNSREKFRPERNDYERRSDDRRGREPWDDRCSNFCILNELWEWAVKRQLSNICVNRTDKGYEIGLLNEL